MTPEHESAAPAPSEPGPGARPPASSTGLDENVAGALCYLGLFVSGIIFLLLEKSSSFVRFHALQSTVTFGVLYVVYWVLGWIAPFAGLVWIGTVILWVVFMVNAYQGERWQLPIIGEIADERSRLPSDHD